MCTLLIAYRDVWSLPTEIIHDSEVLAVMHVHPRLINGDVQ